MMAWINNLKILLKVVLKKINEQNMPKQNFSLNKNENDKESTKTIAKNKTNKKETNIWLNKIRIMIIIKREDKKTYTSTICTIYIKLCNVVYNIF